MAEDGAVRRGEEHLEEVGIIPCEEVCEAAEFEEDCVVAGVGDLIGAGEAEEGIGWLDEDAFEVVVRGWGVGAVGAAAGDDFEEACVRGAHIVESQGHGRR